MQAPPDPTGATTIPDLVRAAAARFGDLSAIEDQDVQLSFVGLLDASIRATRAFCAAGLEPGDRVAIWAPNLHEWIVAALGLQSAGGVLVPMSTRFKGIEAATLLRTSRARMLCTLGSFLGTDYLGLLAGEELPDLKQIVVLRDTARGATPWREFLAAGDSVSEEEAEARAQAVQADDLSDLLFTSGTTGQPKGVMTTHAQNLRAFTAWSEVVALREGDRYLVVNPFFHAFGYKAGWLASLIRGATVLPHAVFDVPAVLERVRKERVSVLPGAPTLYQTILAHPERAQFDLTHLRLAVIGGAAIPVELIQRMRDELGFESVVSGYGLTEACGIVSMCRHDDDPETIATTSGRAIPGVEVRCVDTDGKEVPRGEPGEVVVRGYNVMRGYFENPEETARTVDSDGWLHTGDIARMDERGNLRITGRIKEMFIVGGFNCYPAEIENLMYGYEGIAQVAVIGIPDERMGEVAMAFVVKKPGAELEPEALIAWCREHMSNYKVPRRVRLMDALPTNAGGKVQKLELRELALQES